MCVCVNKREIENVSEICQTSSRKSHPIFHNKRKYSKHTHTQNCVSKERNIQQRSFFSVQQQWFLPEQQNIIMFSEQHREQARERETVGWEMRKIFPQICYREHKPHTVTYRGDREIVFFLLVILQNPRSLSLPRSTPRTHTHSHTQPSIIKFSIVREKMSPVRRHGK